MLSQYMFHKIRKLKKLNKNNSEIARELGINRGTVAKYLAQKMPPEYPKRSNSTREDPFILYQEKVEKWLAKSDKLGAPEIFELLIEEGYLGSIRTVSRRLKDLKGDHV